jgi:hypothetical protein
MFLFTHVTRISFNYETTIESDSMLFSLTNYVFSKKKHLKLFKFYYFFMQNSSFILYFIIKTVKLENK